MRQVGESSYFSLIICLKNYWSIPYTTMSVFAYKQSESAMCIHRSPWF